MKNFFLYLLLVVSSISYSQSTNSLKGHKLKFISRNIEGIQSSCGQSLPRNGNKVNLNIEIPLRVGKIYKLNYGEGLKFYKVVSSSTERIRDADENVFNSIDIEGPFNPCNLTKDTYTYYRLGILGSSIINCGKPTAITKVNINNLNNLKTNKISVKV